jgi:hypothetical protein
MTKYLHTVIRVSSLENTIAFFEVFGLREIRRRPDGISIEPLQAGSVLPAAEPWSSMPNTGSC